MESPILHAFFLLVKNQCGRLGGCHGCWTVSFPPGPGSRPSQGGREGTVTEISAETTQRYFQVSGDSQDQGDQGEVLPAEPGARRQCFRGPTPCTTPNPEPEAGKRAARPPRFPPVRMILTAAGRRPLGASGSPVPEAGARASGRHLLPPAATRERLTLRPPRHLRSWSPALSWGTHRLYLP